MVGRQPKKSTWNFQCVKANTFGESVVVCCCVSSIFSSVYLKMYLQIIALTCFDSDFLMRGFIYVMVYVFLNAYFSINIQLSFNHNSSLVTGWQQQKAILHILQPGCSTKIQNCCNDSWCRGCQSRTVGKKIDNQ